MEKCQHMVAPSCSGTVIFCNNEPARYIDPVNEVLCEQHQKEIGYFPNTELGEE